MRDQSVLVVLEENDLFIFRRLAERDDVNTIGSSACTIEYRNIVQQAKRNESLFTVNVSVVLEGECQAFKNL